MHVGDFHLVNAEGRYFVEVRGRTGEPFADRQVQIQFKHRDFRQPVDVALKSDANGRVDLGALDEIDSVKVSGLTGIEKSWRLQQDRMTNSETLHANSNESIAIAYHEEAVDATTFRF